MSLVVKRLLLTGSAGHLGKNMGMALATRYWVRGLDLKNTLDVQDAVVGSVTDLDTCRAAVTGVDAVVMGHMGPNPGAYTPPFTGIDINVRGTANLYQACLDEGIKRVVLISSASILGPESDPSAPPGACRYGPGRDLYPVTKMMQEQLAHHYFALYGIVTQALRPSWIVTEADQQHKRGVQNDYDSGLIDPGDMAELVHACLQRNPESLEAYTVGQPEYLGVGDTMRRLDWQPKHRFQSLTHIR